ncbi:MAG: YegS/Rv2252/BmrU family lipid kinase [Chitinophagaceae bacterium]|nr:YegS/Rv2252/BmrU family lipid kinase [Chitinophagaceae bacterium]
MSDQKSLKILFVINPGAGAKAKTSWEDAIRDYFDGQTHSVEYFIIGAQDDKPSLEEVIEKIRPQRVVAVGGDGTVSLVAKHLVGSEMALGILPAGSANGMAKELNIPASPKEALDIILNGKIGECDLIEINGKELCLHLSDIGLNAQLIKYFDEGKLRGKLGYAKVVIKTLLNRQPMRVVMQTENEEIRRTAFMVVLANASKYGTGAVINPDGKIDDGFFEVIIVKRLAFSEFMKMLFRPQPFNPRNIQCYKARGITIDTHRKVHFQVDGEYMGRVKHIDARILHHHIALILPATEPGQ